MLFLAPFLFAAAAFGEAVRNPDYPVLPFKEFIFPPGFFSSSHSPSIVELPDGELFAVWYSTWVPKAAVWGSRKPVGADKWTTPYIVNRTPGHANKNPVLFLGRDKKLFLFWVDETRWWFKMVIDSLRMKTSLDLGRTWTEPRDVSKTLWFLPRTHPVRLNNGRILLPIYSDMITSSAVLISEDEGLTWSRPIYMLFLLGIQPTIIQRSDSSLFALTRSGMWPRLSWQVVSHDLGLDWKKRKLSNVSNPGTSLEMLKLKSGNVVLVFNDSKKSRAALSIALSYDDGKTWPRVKVIEYKKDGVNIYPSVMQDRYGLIHVLYAYDNRNSIAHFVTDEKWIESMV